MMRLASTARAVTGLLFTLLASVVPTVTSQAMQVEVDIFSGRPNPSWNVTCDEADEFLRLFRALPESSSKVAVNDDGLGYNGLIVTEPDNSLDGYRQVSVAKGWVVARGDSQSRQFIDQGRKLEQWLLQTGKGRMDDDLYRLINAAVQFK